MAVKTSPRRKRSTFRPTTSSHLQARKTLVFDLEGNPTKVYHQGGGFGFLNNNCRCRSCQATRFGGL